MHYSIILTISTYHYVTLSLPTFYHLILLTISSCHCFNFSLFHPLATPLFHLLIFLTISLSNYFTFTPFHHHILLTILPSLLQLLTISPLTTSPFHDSHYPIPFTISTSHYFTLSPSHHFTCSLGSLSHPSYYLSLSLFCPLTFATVHHLIHSLIISTSFLFTLKLKLHSILFTSSPFHCPTYLTISPKIWMLQLMNILFIIQNVFISTRYEF